MRQGAANAVFRLLRGLHLDRPGAVTAGEVETWFLAYPPRPGGEIGSPRREITPVGGLVEATIRAQAVYAPSFFILLTIAGMIAAVGILANSQILIVGAMVVGPEYTAIIAVALAITKRHRAAIHDGLVALCWGFGAMVITYLFTLVIRESGLVPRAFIGGVRPVASLIAAPGTFSVIIAVLAGIAGVVSLTESRANALIGVFISVTTIPAAAGVGVFAAFGNWQPALDLFAELLLNVVVLVAVGAAGLQAQRVFWRRRTARPADRE